MVDNLPRGEDFNSDYDSAQKNDQLKTKAIMFRHYFDLKLWDHWDRLDEIKYIYDMFGYDRPSSTETWDDDLHFARQRVASVNHNIIRLMTQVPDKLPVTDALLSPLLDGMTVQQAIDEKKMFITDLHILDGIPIQKDDVILCAPIALFFLDKTSQLRPVAIQLFQKPGPKKPSDPSLW